MTSAGSAPASLGMSNSSRAWPSAPVSVECSVMFAAPSIRAVTSAPGTPAPFCFFRTARCKFARLPTSQLFALINSSASAGGGEEADAPRNRHSGVWQGFLEPAGEARRGAERQFESLRPRSDAGRQSACEANSHAPDRAATNQNNYWCGGAKRGRSNRQWCRSAHSRCRGPRSAHERPSPPPLHPSYARRAYWVHFPRGAFAMDLRPSPQDFSSCHLTDCLVNGYYSASPMTDSGLQAYTPLLLHLLIATALAGALTAASVLVGWRRPSRAKQQPYECGMEPTGDARAPISVRFYLVAMVFILFDVEAIFLYPWDYIYRDFIKMSPSIGLYGFAEMMVYIAILLVGYFYLWKKGALDWHKY